MDQLKKIYRVARWLMLASTLMTGFLVLKSPAPLAETLTPALVKQNADSFQQKLTELATAQSSGETGAEVHFTAPEVNAAIIQATFPQPAPGGPTPASQPTPGAAAAQVPIKSTQVSFEDDVVKGQFLSEVYGKDVSITVAGHLGSRDGYVTFEPTEFKVGDLSMPVSMVNPVLQRKLADPENRDKMKLPEFVKDLRVQNGELVITE
ncbi:MAG TPA: hypothetical protein VJP83_14285 [Terriglobales bacterium]|nr:hypothetical protein [Terriglobales bacterium]